MNVALKVKGHFDASHRLVHYDGKCNQLHGHRFVYELVIKHPVDSLTGIAIDFKELKANYLKKVEDWLDHKHLNDVLMVEPTAENLAIEIFKFLYQQGLEYLVSVEVWESPEASALVTFDDFCGELNESM